MHIPINIHINIYKYTHICGVSRYYTLASQWLRDPNTRHISLLSVFNATVLFSARGSPSHAVYKASLALTLYKIHINSSYMRTQPCLSFQLSIPGWARGTQQDVDLHGSSFNKGFWTDENLYRTHFPLSHPSLKLPTALKWNKSVKIWLFLSI